MSWNNDDGQNAPRPAQPHDPWGHPQQPAQQPPPQNPWGQPVQQPTDPYGRPAGPAGAPYPGQAQPGAYPQADPYQQPGGSSPSSQGTAPYPHQPSQPEPRKRRGALIAVISIAVVVVLLVVGGIVGVNLGNAAFAPENSVRAYLDALKRGDAAAALELSGAETTEADVLLTDEVYAEVDGRISRYRIEETVVEGDTATVTATITQAGEDYEQEFTLTKSGKAAVLFDTWSLDAPELATVSATVDAPEGTVTTVAGVDVSAAEPGEDGALTLRALPGSYEVAVTETDWYSAEAQTATVVGFGEKASPEAVDLTVALTDTGREAATDAVDAFLDQCVASGQLEPEGCPFGATGGTPGYQYTNIVWTLDPRPTFSIGEYRDGAWSVTTDSAGSASMVCDLLDPSTGATGQATAGPINVRVSGSITGFGEDGAIYEP